VLNERHNEDGQGNGKVCALGTQNMLLSRHVLWIDVHRVALSRTCLLFPLIALCAARKPLQCTAVCITNSFFPISMGFSAFASLPVLLP
jgi:hypothetical protein